MCFKDTEVGHHHSCRPGPWVGHGTVSWHLGEEEVKGVERAAVLCGEGDVLHHLQTCCEGPRGCPELSLLGAPQKKMLRPNFWLGDAPRT